MAKMRVRVAMIHYRDDASVGGSLRVGETLAKNLNPGEVEVHFCFAYGGPGPIHRRTTLPCHYLMCSGRSDFRGWMGARRLFKAMEADVLHFQNSVNWLRIALAGHRAATVIHIHGPLNRSEMSWRNRVLNRLGGLT